MKRLGTRAGLVFALTFAISLAVGPAGAPAASPAPGSAVVLVSGFDTVTPFTTSNPTCTGKEGEAWDPPTGVARALKNAGYTVFTAPVMQGGGQPGTPCAPGTAAPPLNTYINSNGDLTANGQALGRFIAFLRDNYGVSKIDIVGHSDGGLWSRSAITQQSNYPGVDVTSLTTLGTPHTGSFVADIAEVIQVGQCKVKDPVFQLVCLGVQKVVQQVIQDLGPQTVLELTSFYLATWNPEQKLGSCPVTGIAGTFFNFPIPPAQLPAYYNPSDGLVGEASVLAQQSSSIFGTPIPAPGIPNFRTGGTFPVVHGTSFAWLTNQNLLDTTAISSLVVATLGAQPAGGPTCTVTPQPPQPQAATDGIANSTFPLHAFVAPRKGKLPPTRATDVLLFSSKARVRCGRRRIASTSFPQHPEMRIAVAPCQRGPRVKGKGRVLLIRTVGTASIEISGQSVKLAVNGMRARRVKLQLAQGGRFATIPLSGSLTGSLPPGAGPTTLRVQVRTRKLLKKLRTRTLVGSATLSR